MTAADRELDSILEDLHRAAESSRPGRGRRPRPRRLRQFPCRTCRAIGTAGWQVYGPGGSCADCIRAGRARLCSACGNGYVGSGLPCTNCGAAGDREAEPFVIRTPRFGIPEGHERLTRDAAAGLAGIGTADVPPLIEGSRRVDYGLTNHFKADEQRRHFLRRSLCQNLSAALGEARNTLADLHGRALAAFARGPRAGAFGWAGEALHLIQDSYSAAHTERDWAALNVPIVYIRYFGPWGDPAPREHRVLPPPDPRDLIAPHGFLIREARAAIATSREYLTLLIRHAAGMAAAGRMPAAAVARELAAFMNRHFALSPRRTEPRTVYLRCRIF
jgi:hypothetical protein